MNNMESVKISLIVPVYNVEPWLVECLESIVQQTVPFYEVFLVNDGSTDGSGEICREYADKYDNIYLTEQENTGQATARNRALKCSAGDYIMFLDSDDFFELDAVEKLIPYVKKNRFDAVFFDFDCCVDGDFDDATVRYALNRYKKNRWPQKVMKGQELFDIAYPKSYFCPAYQAIYRRQLLLDKEIFFPDGIFYEDQYFVFVLMHEAEHVYYVPEIISQRRIREESTTTSAFSERKLMDHITCYALIWRYIEKKGIYKGRESIIQQYLSDHCNIVLCRLEEFRKQQAGLSIESEAALKRLMDQYFNLSKSICSDILQLSTDNLSVMVKNYVLIEKRGLAAREQLMDMGFQELIRACVKAYEQILSRLPLSDVKSKIGIYGGGQHTKGLLAAYRKLIGEINAEIIMIDSVQTEGVNMGFQVLNYREIDHTFDMIVISSFLYEQEMLENLKKVNKNIPVLTFYDDINADLFYGCESLLEYV